MSAYIVGYDLSEPGQQYACLKERIEAYGYYCHLQKSVWIIVTSDSAASIRDNLKVCLDRNDSLFVARLSGEAAWIGLDTEVSDWLMKALNS